MTFDEWYSSARPRVLATLVLAVGNLDMATEATDEAMTRAVARWSTVGGMDSPVGWVVRVALNVAHRRARRATIETRLLRRSVPRPDVPAAAGEAWLAVAELPRRQREVLVLRYVAELPEAEIARALGISRSTVSDALTDGRRRLALAFRDPIERQYRHV